MKKISNDLEVWEQNWRNKPRWGGYPNEMIIRFFAKHAQKSPHPFTVLEVGCGAGNNLWFFARENMKIYGIDGSPSAIEAATARLNKEKPGWQGELSIGNITTLPYPDNFFDFVVDIEALSCLLWDDAKLAYREIRRVLKPKGKFCSVSFAEGCWGEGTGEKIEDNTWIVTEGPVATGGHTRFIKFDMIPILISPMVLENINQVTRTIDGLDHIVKEWIIEASPKK